jgi:hypothetical protein
MSTTELKVSICYSCAQYPDCRWESDDIGECSAFEEWD